MYFIRLTLLATKPIQYHQIRLGAIFKQEYITLPDYLCDEVNFYITIDQDQLLVICRNINIY